MSEGNRGEPVTPAESVAKIVRDFEYSRETVFRMITDPKRAARWFGSPEGPDPVLFELEAKPGGRLRIHGQNPDGSIAKTSGSVLEVVAPERFVFTSATTLQDGAIPFEAHQSLTLESLGPRKTRVTVVVTVRSTGSFPGGAGALAEGYAGGWGQSLDKLQRQLD